VTAKKNIIEGLQVYCIEMADIINQSAENMNNLSDGEVGLLKNLFDYNKEYTKELCEVFKENFSATPEEQKPEIVKNMLNRLINSPLKDVEKNYLPLEGLTDQEFNVKIGNILCDLIVQYFVNMCGETFYLFWSVRPEKRSIVFQELFKGLYSC